MRTIKLVIIGDSGVGKTSLRSNYVSGRFSSGYRATIGTDFITKALPHHSNPGEVVTLQIWDTAGQERFSSLSTAFFRGADAVLMMYDVNNPMTLQGLRKWWKEFQERAPVSEEEAFDYCCVVVGNKIDLVEKSQEGHKMPVTEDDARTLLGELIPTSTISPAPTTPGYQDTEQVGERTTPSEENTHVLDGNGFPHLDDEEDELSTVRPKPIDIRLSNHTGDRRSVSRATSRSRLSGTMTTTRTGLSIYHTPSSSLFDEFVSAPSSPIHSNPSTLTSRTRNQGVPSALSRRRSTNFSTSSSATIRPASSPPTPTPLDRGPKLFLASAKSGYAVPSIFEYVAKRVVARWEWEERMQTRTLEYTDRTSEFRPVHLSQSKNDSGWDSPCCS